jgi:hypothetical protein
VVHGEAVHTHGRRNLDVKVKDEDVKLFTLVSYDRLWRFCVAPRWADVPENQVSFRDAKDWLAE